MSYWGSDGTAGRKRLEEEEAATELIEGRAVVGEEKGRIKDAAMSLAQTKGWPVVTFPEEDARRRLGI